MKPSRLMSWPAYLWSAHGIGPPSNGVFLNLLYQSTTSRLPSGLSIGMMISTTFAQLIEDRRDRSRWPARRAADWRPAWRRPPSRGCCSRWRRRLCAWRRSGCASSGGSVRGSASRWLSRFDLIEVADVLGRRDDRGDRAVVLGGRPEVGDLHAIGAGGDELEVFLDRVRRSKISVGAHAKAEMRFGRWNAIGLLLARGRTEEQSRANERRDAPRAHRGIIAEGRSTTLRVPLLDFDRPLRRSWRNARRFASHIGMLRR